MRKPSNRWLSLLGIVVINAASGVVAYSDDNGGCITEYFADGDCDDRNNNAECGTFPVNTQCFRASPITRPVRPNSPSIFAYFLVMFTSRLQAGALQPLLNGSRCPNRAAQRFPHHTLLDAAFTHPDWIDANAGSIDFCCEMWTKLSPPQSPAPSLFSCFSSGRRQRATQISSLRHRYTDPQTLSFPCCRPYFVSIPNTPPVWDARLDYFEYGRRFSLFIFSFPHTFRVCSRFRQW